MASVGVRTGQPSGCLVRWQVCPASVAYEYLWPPWSGMVAEGMTADEILDAFPYLYLEREDIAEALRYAAEAVRERQLPLVAGG